MTAMPAADRRRWPLIVPAVLAAAVVLYALIGYFVAPGLVRDKLQQALGEELSRPVRVERVEIRPFALAATVHGLAIDQPDGKPLLRVEAIEADASIASLWHRAPVVDALRVVRPHLSVARTGATRYDVSDLLDKWMAPSPGPPAKYSLNNIEVVEGRIDFDDRPMRRAHRAEAIRVGVPFLSSLPYHTDVNVEPRLEANVNGTPFALAGQAKPYSERHEAALDVNVDALPLPQYVDYLPAKLRFRLAGGALTTRLKIAFAQPPGAAPEIAVAGTASLAALDVKRRDGSPLVAAREIRVALEKLDLREQSLRVASAAVDAPSLAVRRLADGSIELAGSWTEGAGAPASPDAKPWRVEVAEASVREGRASVEDASIEPAYKAVVSAFEATAKTLATGPERKGRVSASFRIDDEAAAKLAAEVALAPFSATGNFEVAGARLARLYPYAAQALNLAIRSGSADYASSFALAANGDVKLTAGKGAVRDLVLIEPGEREPLWRMPELAVDGVDVDVPARSVTIAAATIRRPRVLAERDTRGDWNVARLVRTPSDSGAAKPAAADDGWQFRVARLAVERGELAVADATTKPPLKARADEIGIVITDFGNARGRKSSVDMRARIERSGRLAVKGPYGMQPFSATFDVRAADLPLLVAKPLIEREANLTLTGGTAGARGRLEASAGDGGATRLTWTGDVALANVEALDPPTGGRLFAWRTFAFDRMKVRNEPFEANVETASLADFYARLIVYADGTINLAKLARRTSETAPAPPASKPAVAKPIAARPRAGAAIAAAADSAQQALRRAGDGSLPIAVGRVTLANGNVNFSDFFIRPNYSANLTQVAGTVSSLSPTQAGEVALTAKVDDAAPVTVSGRIQPFARELSLALAGKARDIELPPLSPYAAKYAGYGITKGKLAFDVDYTVENRKLDAKNRLVIDQLTFGERVESPDATKLPVLLAVSLLKDANGVIDLDLPIGGTIDDPQFSVLGLIFKVIGNLLTKAATAPFALLGAAAGGGEELAWVEFAAGSASLDGATNERLDKLAKALSSRPGLKVDAAGRVDAASDGAAMAKESLERALRAAKARASAGKPGAPLSPDTTAIAAEERAQWIAAAYRELPDAAKEATPTDMETALAKRHQPDAQALTELGLKRSGAAKDALVARGVAAERVFVVTTKPGEQGAKGSPRRVDFALK
jgi:uncharacterized protein involved in outer membrane biogenesis